MGDSLAARDVGYATADRGVTAPAHAGTRAPQAHADAGADVKHAWRRLREGPTHQRQRTHALRARDGIHPGAKQSVDTLRRDGWGTHVLLAVFP